MDLGSKVRCEMGDIDDLRFADNTFDYVMCQVVFTFVPHKRALSEVRRVLKDDGVFAGLELCWRRLPPDPLRERTARILGCKKLDFHSLLGWVGTLRTAHFSVARAEEFPIRVFSPAGLLHGEAWANSLRIVAKLMRQRASRVRMAEIWSHFSRSRDYYSCVVFSGSKQAKGQVKLKLQGNCLGNIAYSRP
jgi:SAM-dependent methyltransferase